MTKEELPVINDDLISLTSDSDFSKALKELNSDDNLMKKTDLTAKDIGKLTIIYSMSKKYDIPLLKQLADTFISLRVSKDRKGRTESVSMTQQIGVFKRLEAVESELKKK